MFVVTSLIIGGAEKQLIEILRRISRPLFDPVVVCLKEPGVLAAELDPLGIPIYSRLLSHKYDLRVLPRLISIIRKEKPVILWARNFGDKMFWGRLAGKMTKVPVILASIHSSGIIGQKESVLGTLNKALTPITDLFLAVSENQKRYLVEGEGLPEDKITVIHNGIDLEAFKPRKDPQLIRRELGIDPKGKVVGQVAKLRPEKGHDLLLEAAGMVLKAQREVGFLLIGDGPERDRLKERCRSLGIADRVWFLGDRKDLPDMINVLDIGTLSSPMEAFPNALLEYMALAKPVIAPRVGGVPEIITHGSEGYLFSPGNSQEMAHYLLKLLADPGLMQAMGEAGRERVRSAFPLNLTVQKIEQLLLSQMSAKGLLKE
jgi:glycosyltransferase involved in cell wall biosynthesis